MNKRKLIYTAALTFAAVIVGAIGSACSRDEQNLNPNTEEHDVPPVSAAEEVRGVWIASVYNINYPSSRELDASALKSEIDEIIDCAVESGLNTVCFQARPSCDALYDSGIFPVSSVISAGRVLPDGFDPLGYIVAKAHSAGIDVIAWINPLRVTASKADDREAAFAQLSQESPAAQHPEYCVFYGGGLWLDPGIPDVRQLVADGVREIVTSYDVDGVIFDDYFYPYPSDGDIYDDSASSTEFGGGKERGDFRRENVNELVRLCGETVKNADADLSFGVSPFGIWRNSSTDPRGSDTAGLQAYDTLYCDALAWIDGGYIDYIAPQLYWSGDNQKASYDILLKWWSDAVKGSNVKLMISHGTYKISEWNSSDEIARQIAESRMVSSYAGGLHYGYAAIRDDVLGIKEKLAGLYSPSMSYTD